MPEVKWGVKGREYVGGRVKVGVRGCAKTKMLGENFTLGAECGRGDGKKLKESSHTNLLQRAEAKAVVGRFPSGSRHDQVLTPSLVTEPLPAATPPPQPHLRRKPNIILIANQ